MGGGALRRCVLGGGALQRGVCGGGGALQRCVLGGGLCKEVCGGGGGGALQRCVLGGGALQRGVCGAGGLCGGVGACDKTIGSPFIKDVLITADSPAAGGSVCLWTARSGVS